MEVEAEVRHACETGTSGSIGPRDKKAANARESAREYSKNEIRDSTADSLRQRRSYHQERRKHAARCASGAASSSRQSLKALDHFCVRRASSAGHNAIGDEMSRPEICLTSLGNKHTVSESSLLLGISDPLIASPCGIDYTPKMFHNEAGQSSFSHLDTDRVLIQLVSTVVRVGLSQCHLAHSEPDFENRLVHLSLARNAHEDATGYLSQIELQGRQFDGMAAEVDRLEMQIELEEFRRWHPGRLPQ